MKRGPERVVAQARRPSTRPPWRSTTGAAKGNIATGVGVALQGDELLGFGLAWTRTAAIGGQNQYTAELFYRLHVLRNLAMTPDVQVVLNLLGRPTGSAVAIAGLRARVNF